MPFCKKCGTQLTDDARFCPTCGEAVEAAVAAAAVPPVQNAQPVQQPVPPVQNTQPVQQPVPPVQNAQPVQQPVPPVQNAQPVQQPVPPVQNTQPVQQPVPPVQNAQSDTFSATVKKLNDTPDSTAEFDPTDIAQNKGMAILSYFGLLLLIPLFGAKNSKFARYHANQGLTLLLVEVVYGILNGIFTVIRSLVQTTKYVYGFYPVKSTPWFVSVPLGIVSAVLGIATLALAIIGIVNAANGKAKELPLIGKFKLLK